MALAPLVASMRSMIDSSILSASADWRKLSTLRAPFRSTRQAILIGLLDPTDRLRAAENAGRSHERLALMELTCSLPWGAVWDELCQRDDVPAGVDWLRDIERYEKAELSRRR